MVEKLQVLSTRNTLPVEGITMLEGVNRRVLRAGRTSHVVSCAFMVLLLLLSCGGESTDPSSTAGSISGTIEAGIRFFGENGDLISEGTAPVVEYPTVYLLRDNAILDSTTCTGGKYIFNNVIPGQYRTMIRMASDSRLGCIGIMDSTCVSSIISVGDGEPEVADPLITSIGDDYAHRLQEPEEIGDPIVWYPLAAPNSSSDTLRFDLERYAYGDEYILVLETFWHDPVDTIAAGDAVGGLGEEGMVWSVGDVEAGLYWAILRIRYDSLELWQCGACQLLQIERHN